MGGRRRHWRWVYATALELGLGRRRALCLALRWLRRPARID